MFVEMLIVVFVSILCVYTLKNKKKNRPPLVVGAWPIVGNTFNILRNSVDLYKFILDLSMDCLRQGGVTTLQIVTTDVYAVADPEYAYMVLNSCLQKDAFYDYFKPWIGEGLITSTETKWKKHRKLLNPTFNQVVLDGYLSKFNEQARLLVNNLDAKAGKRKFDPAPYMEHTAFQLICCTAMGVAVDEKDVEIRKEYIELKSKFLDGLVKRAQTFWLHSEFIYSLSNLNKSQKECARSLHGLTRAVVKERKEKMTTDKVNIEQRFKPFLELLLDMEADGILTDAEVKEEVDSFIAAGSETTAITVMVALLNVASYPDVQRKVVEELRQVFNGSDDNDLVLVKQDLVQLKYLEAVIKETMRLYPTVPIVGRTLDKDVKIGNYTLPSGSRCYISVLGVNRHSSWGPDAEQFRPERWLNPGSLPSHCSFASFGLGRRKCIGENFAMMAMKTILAHVLRCYRVSGDVTQLELNMEVVGRPVSKDYITIERREMTEAD